MIADFLVAPDEIRKRYYYHGVIHLYAPDRVLAAENTQQWQARRETAQRRSAVAKQSAA
jgi:hypothetical protein